MSASSPSTPRRGPVSARFVAGAVAAVLGLVSVLLAGTPTKVVAAAKPAKLSDKDRQTKIDKLEPFNALIAEWRCNGFVPGRDKNKTGWEETSSWIWVLKGDVAVRFATEGAKILENGSITYDIKEDKFVMAAKRVDGQKVTYTGEFNDDKSRFVAEGELKGGEKEKITIKFLDKIRVVFEVERAKPGKDPVVVAEIGGTRKGEKISGASDEGPKCVITGGPGTSSVSYGGKGYYICCTGCRDAFNEDPVKWIALAKKKGYIKE